MHAKLIHHDAVMPLRHTVSHGMAMLLISITYITAQRYTSFHICEVSFVQVLRLYTSKHL